METARSERTMIFLIGAVQFVNILDFMIVTPLGPDFAAALGIPISQLGLIGGSYAVSGCIAGLLGALFLDRFDRRKALGVALLGLVFGTALGGFGTGLYTLMGARLLAGMFGGPATSLAMSILADVVPAERRGRALGSVMGAFAAASVMGVPAGLFLARHGGWRLPFFAIAGLGLLLTVLCISLMPPMRGHLQRTAETPKEVALIDLVQRGEVLMSLILVGLVMLSNFAVIPNIAAFMQYNSNVPRTQMEQIYAIGGVCSFIATRIFGRLVDRLGAPRVALFGTVLLLAILGLGFLADRTLVPATAMVSWFMVAQAARNIAAQTLNTRVPYPHERARYQSLLSAFQHMASALGAMAATLFLTVLPNGRLGGMPKLVSVAMCISALQPLMVLLVERQLRARTARAAVAVQSPTATSETQPS